MSDRALLEAAAKAAGVSTNQIDIGAWCGCAWNPLLDDREAFLLAVKLRLSIDHNHPADNDAWVMASRCDGMGVGPTEVVDGEASRAAATRRAIVRAAAAFGSGHEGAG